MIYFTDLEMSSSRLSAMLANIIMLHNAYKAENVPHLEIGHTVPSTNIGTLGKYEQGRLWK